MRLKNPFKKKKISFEEQKRQARQAMKNWDDLVDGKYGKKGLHLAKDMIEIEKSK